MLTRHPLPRTASALEPAREQLARIPGCTYRLQFSRRFGFRQARELVPYLKELGATDLYASPVFKARAGSAHGYDVVDPGSLNPEIGTEDEFREMTDALREAGMGLIIDAIPNHMGIGDSANAWWNDVLENGPASPFARFFDIDWRPLKRELSDKVLLPLLGDQYGWVLEHQQIRLEYKDGRFEAVYGGLRLPIAPRTWGAVLRPALAALRRDIGENDERTAELESILTELGHLPPRSETDPARVAEGLREKEVVKRRLSALVETYPPLAREIDNELRSLNGAPGNPASFDELEKLLSEQAYRLSHWRVASDEVNYRRFFDMNDLAAVRIEKPEVFAAIHARLLRLAQEGIITGIRVDHVDGLFDPEGYLSELRAGCSIGRSPPYLVVEKILNRRERLRASWPIEGTTGYDFLRLVNGLFIHPNGLRIIERGYSRFTGIDARFGIVARDSKRLIMQTSMSSEMHMLAARLDRISEQHRWSRDFTRESLRAALIEVLAGFEVYRTYIRPLMQSVEPDDRLSIFAAVGEAKRANPAVDESIFDFIGSVLLLEHPPGLSEEDRSFRRQFVMRVQQISGTVMARGVEDTAFYRHHPLASLNEVGSDPERGRVTPQEFHDRNIDRLRSWPHTMLTTSTHDTKRGEDARARLDALSEIPSEWQKALLRWQRLNLRLKTTLHGAQAPDNNEEYLIYQTLISAWSHEGLNGRGQRAFSQRMQDSTLKALREAKLHSSWIASSSAWEHATAKFVERLLMPKENPFLSDFLAFMTPLSYAGILNSLSQTLLKLSAPGLPDLYQGTELWDLAQVDPDNRRPVDFERRRKLLVALKRSSEGLSPERRSTFACELMNNAEDGRIKLYLLWKALRMRASQPELFSRGDYLPLRFSGPKREHLVAFARVYRERELITCVGRFFLRLGIERSWPPHPSKWGSTVLELGRDISGRTYRDLLTGVTLEVGPHRSLAAVELLSILPVALLERIK